MKIAHIVRRYTPTEWGGTETVVFHTVSEQLKLGHDARIFCTSALQPAVSDPSPSCSSRGFQPTTFDYLYPYFPMPKADRVALDKKGGNPYSPSLFRAVAAWKPDLIHIHAGGRLACAAVKLAEKLGVPSVMSLHGGAAVVPKEEMELMLRPLKRKFPYGGILDRVLGLRFDPLARVSAVVAISYAEVARLQSLYPRQSIHYLPNGIDLSSPLTSSPSPLTSHLSPLHNVLCVSRIDYQKNQMALVDLLAAFPDIHLTLVGPVTAPWYAEKIKTHVAELKVQDRFTLIPGLPPDSPELVEQYRKADVFILPSLHEPFGIVALEAMRAGLPLIASQVGGLPDFVKDGENGLLFNPSEPTALAQTFRRLTPELADRLVAGGFSTVSDYAWPKVIGRLEEIYVSCQKGVRP